MANCWLRLFSRWLGGIPKSQMIRVRRNCDKVEDYDNQAEVISKSFLEKGYDWRDLRKTKERIRNMDRESLFKKKEKKKIDYDVSFLTDYTWQHKQFEQILKEHWFLLLKDRELKNILPAKSLHKTTHTLATVGTECYQSPPGNNLPFWIKLFFFQLQQMCYV